MSMSAFIDAIGDYRYLLNKQYPQKALLKLIGDRYRLSRIERNCLFRGVARIPESGYRAKKIITCDEVAGMPLGIDWYNVLITVDSYLRGHPLFISDDGILRDSSAVHGSFQVKKTTDRAIDEIIVYLAGLFPERLGIFLDSPISHSGIMANRLRGICASAFSIPFFIELVQSADYPLKSFEGNIASSDSIICDHAQGIFDLARHVLFSRFDFDPPLLAELKL